MKFRTKFLISTAFLLALAGGLYFWQGQELFNLKPDGETGSAAKEAELPAPFERDGTVIDDSVVENSESQANQPDNDEPWISSASGNISLIRPTENEVLKSGSTIRGTANVSSISYRLIDDAVGVIATGNLNVVDGQFSGTFAFNSGGASGRLDIFSTTAQGDEINIIEAPVRFQ